MVTATKPKTIEEFIKRLNNLINGRITDSLFTSGSPMFSDAHRMAARARVDELEWVKRNLARLVEK